MLGISAACIKSWEIPIATLAVRRTASMRSRKPISASNASGASSPVTPTSSARMKTQGLAASTILASIDPTPSTSKRSTGFPVGNNFPVFEPPGAKKSRETGEPLPATPGRMKSPSTAA